MNAKRWFKKLDENKDEQLTLNTQKAAIKCYAGITEEGPWIGVDRLESPWVFMDGPLEMKIAQTELVDYAGLWFKSGQGGEPIQILSIIRSYQDWEETRA